MLTCTSVVLNRFREKPKKSNNNWLEEIERTSMMRRDSMRMMMSSREIE